MRLVDPARLSYAYGMSLASYLADGTPHPFSATFAVTNQCNIRCSYCNFPFLDRDTLALDGIQTIFERLCQLGVRRLGLTGGEPLLREDIARIVGKAKELGFFVTINTNLMLFERNPAVLDDVDLVFTSLDGDAAHHDENRGKGAHEGLLEAMAALIRRGKPVIAICVVTEKNIDQAGWLLRQGEAMGFRVHFQPQCRGAVVVRGKRPRAEANDLFRAFWRDLLKEKKRGRPVASSVAYLEFLSVWKDFSISAFYAPGVRCAAGSGFLFIDPLGDAYPCVYLKGKMRPVNLLAEDWRAASRKETPCTSCNIGPMLEFNLLFQKPVETAFNALRSYATRPTRQSPAGSQD